MGLWLLAGLAIFLVLQLRSLEGASALAAASRPRVVPGRVAAAPVGVRFLSKHDD